MSDLFARSRAVGIVSAIELERGLPVAEVTLRTGVAATAIGDPDRAVRVRTA